MIVFRFIVAALVAALVSVSSAGIARAQPTGGAEFGVNRLNVTGTQAHPILYEQNSATSAELTGGNWVHVYDDQFGADGNLGGAFVRILDGTNTEVTADFSAANSTANVQAATAVAALSNGNFIVTWSDDNALDGSGYSVQARIFDPTGTPVANATNAGGEQFTVNTDTGLDERRPDVAAFAGGGFVITFMEDRGGGNPIFARIFSNDGTAAGNNFFVNSSGVDENYPVITTLINDDFVVAWLNTGDTDINARRFNSTGTAYAADFVVNTTTADVQDRPSIASLQNGGFVVGWIYNDLVGNINPAFRVYDSDAAATSVETIISNAAGTGGVSVAGLPDAGFVIAYDRNGADAQGGGILAATYDSAGTVIDAEFLVNSETGAPDKQLGNQIYPSVTQSSDGFVISWEDHNGRDGNGTGLFARNFVTFALVANTRVIDAFVTAASDFGGAGTDEIASELDFGAVDVTGDLQFAVVVQNDDQFAGHSNAVLTIELEGAVFDGNFGNSVFLTGGACTLLISGGGADGGSTVKFSTTDLSTCDDRVSDRDYTPNTNDDDMVFTLPVRLTSTEVNFSIDLSWDFGTNIGSDTQDNNDNNSVADNVATAIDAFGVSSFGNGARSTANPHGSGTTREATLVSNYNGLDNNILGTLETDDHGLVYSGGALRSSDSATDVDEVVLTVTVDDITGLEALSLDDGGTIMTSSFNASNEAVFTLNGTTDLTIADLAAAALDIAVVPDSDADTAIAITTVSASTATTFAAALGLTNESNAGAIDQIGREGDDSQLFEWVGDSSHSTSNVFRLTGLGDTLPTIRVVLSNANTSGLNGTYVLTPSNMLTNGELIITASDIEAAAGAAYGTADITLSIEGTGVNFNRLMISNGAIRDMGDDNASAGPK